MTSQLKRKQVPKRAKVDSWYTYIGKDVGSHPCLCCHKTQITQSDFHAGHIIPASKDGDESINNIVPICLLCNTSMSATHMVEFQKRLSYFPTIDTIINKVLNNQTAKDNIEKDIKIINEKKAKVDKIIQSIDSVLDSSYRNKKYATQYCISMMNINDINFIINLKQMATTHKKVQLTNEIQKLEDLLKTDLNHIKLPERLENVKSMFSIFLMSSDYSVVKSVETDVKEYKSKRKLLLDTQLRDPSTINTVITENCKCHFCNQSIVGKTVTEYGHHILTKHFERIKADSSNKDFNIYCCPYCSNTFFSFIESNLGNHFIEVHKNLLIANTK